MASPEPKALQTVQELTGVTSIPTDPGFAEVRRPYVESDYRALARAYVEGVCHDGWEPHVEVFQRFDAIRHLSP